MPMINTLLADCSSLPDPWASPLYIPILFTMFGAGLFAAGKAAEIRDMKPVPWKWVGVVPLLIALWSGLQTVSCLRDPFYTALMNQLASKKYLTSHIGSIAFPLIAIIALAIWQWRSTRDPFRN